MDIAPVSRISTRAATTFLAVVYVEASPKALTPYELRKMATPLMQAVPRASSRPVRRVAFGRVALGRVSFRRVAFM